MADKICPKCHNAHAVGIICPKQKSDGAIYKDASITKAEFKDIIQEMIDAVAIGQKAQLAANAELEAFKSELRKKNRERVRKHRANKSSKT